MQIFSVKFKAKYININCNMEIKLFKWLSPKRKALSSANMPTVPFLQNLGKTRQFLNVPSSNTKVCMNFSNVGRIWKN